MQAQEGVKAVHVSGLRSTVIMEDGKALDEAKLRDAMGSKRLKLVSLEVADQAKPKLVYGMKVKGAG